MNLGPIAVGQGVVLHDRAEDCFNPHPSLRPLMEGRLEAIINRTPHWLTFQITSREGELAMLSVHDYKSVCNPLPGY